MKKCRLFFFSQTLGSSGLYCCLVFIVFFSSYASTAGMVYRFWDRLFEFRDAIGVSFSCSFSLVSISSHLSHPGGKFVAGWGIALDTRLESVYCQKDTTIPN